MSSPAIYFNAFASRRAAATALAKVIAAGLEKPGAPRSLVLPGGSSPRELFPELRGQRLDWPNITVLPSDERWVTPEHDDSNERLIARDLLRDAAADARLFGLYRAGQTPEDAAPGLDAALEEHVPGAFDHVVLGMGTDGHTASIFPDATNLASMLASRDNVVVPERADTGPQRISLSLARLLRTRAISLLFFGDDKRAVFKAARADCDALQHPVASVLAHALVPVRVFWAA